jgi:hypothetical protein
MRRLGFPHDQYGKSKGYQPALARHHASDGLR